MGRVKQQFKLGLGQPKLLPPQEASCGARCLSGQIRAAQILSGPQDARCRRLRIALQEPLPELNIPYASPKGQDALQGPQVVQSFFRKPLLGGTVRVGPVKVQLVRYPGQSARLINPSANGLIVLVNSAFPERISFHQLPGDQLGTGHPPRVFVLIVEGQQGLLIHGQHVPGWLPHLKKLR